VDELYDGPFCVLSAVDSPNQRRLLYEVLEQDPSHDDIRRFLLRLRSAIAARGGVMRGITTDGSALYPQPLAHVFPEVPHQVCEFHVPSAGIAATGVAACVQPVSPPPVSPPELSPPGQGRP
jgi:hypothetical protein